MKWFKFYIEAVYDESGKLKDFTDEELGTTCRFLSLCGMLSEGGRFAVNGVGLPKSSIIQMSLSRSEKASDTFDALLERGTITLCNGVYEFKNWKKYQSEYERKKAHEISKNKKKRTKGRTK